MFYIISCFFLLLVNLAPFLVPSCLVIVIVILPVFPFCYVKSCALNSFTCMSSLFNYHISRFTLRVRIPCAFPLFLLLVPCFLYDLVHLCLISTFPNYPSVYIVCVCFCSPSQWSRPLVFLVFEGLSVLSSLRFSSYSFQFPLSLMIHICTTLTSVCSKQLAFCHPGSKSDSKT